MGFEASKVVTLANLQALGLDQSTEILDELSSSSRWLAKQAKLSKAAGETEKATLFDFLAEISSIQFAPSDLNTPYKPKLQYGGQRSIIPADIPLDVGEAILAFALTLPSCSVKARLLDVVWVAHRKIEAARGAIAAYLDAGQAHADPRHWVAPAAMLERGFRLARQISAPGILDDAERRVQKVIDDIGGQDPLYLSEKLIRLLLEFGRGNSTQNADLAGIAAKLAADQKDYRRARTYLTLRADLLTKAGDVDEAKKVSLDAAETYAFEADARISGSDPSFFAGAHFLKQAIEAFRNIGGQSARVNALHAKLLEWQRLSLGELKSFSLEFPIGDLPVRAGEHVGGYPLEQAVQRLAMMFDPTSFDESLKQAKELVARYPLQHLLTAYVSDGEGKTIGVVEPAKWHNAEVNDAHLHQVLEFARNNQLVQGIGLVVPAAERVRLEHPVERANFIELLTDNPFVPPDRVGLFAQGLCAGFDGDWPVAAHLLIPQIENSIRYVFSGRGLSVSRLDKDGLQREAYLPELLHSAEFAEIFGNNLSLDLRSLLTERRSSNLRNRLAHGLIGHDELFSPFVAYLWWVTLRLCVIPSLRQATAAIEANKPSHDPNV
jgi:hypothetical protein